MMGKLTRELCIWWAMTIVMGYGWCKLKPFVMRSVSNAVMENDASTIPIGNCGL